MSICLFGQTCDLGDQGGGPGSNHPGGPGSSGGGAGFDISVSFSVDPNEIIGVKGYETFQWVKVSDKLAYTIYFENDPNFATAAAQKVEVRYTFHAKADLYSLGLGSFGFGNLTFVIDGAPSVYQKRLDVRESLGIYVDVIAGLDVIKKEAFWIFQSIDPETGLPPSAVDRGFLPVNDKEKHNGEGFVTFVMKPIQTCQTRDTLSAHASIIFDTNIAIPTNRWVNMIDAGAPSSKLVSVADATDKTKYRFSFEANDDKNGSGVKRVTLYLSKNKEAYKEYKLCPPDTIMTFFAENGTEYAFYSIAEDNTGNLEPSKQQADQVINANDAPTDLILSNLNFNDDIAAGGFIGELSSVDTGESQTFTYSLAEGDGAIHNDLFTVSGNRLIAKNSFKCAIDSVYKIRLSTTDVGGLSFKKPFVLKLKHVLEKPKPVTINGSICEGDTYSFFGSNYDKTRTYTYIKTNQYTCDSIYVLDLRVNPYPAQPTINVEGNATLASSSLIGNQWYNADGPIAGAINQSFTPDQTGNYYVISSSNNCKSSPSTTYFVNLSDKLNLSWDFIEGWNWISSNLSDANLKKPKMFLDPIKTNVKKLLGQTDELVNDPVYGLTGGLTALSAEASYKLSMNQTANLAHTGTPVDPAVTTIKINKGWSWIGYVPNVSLATDVALSNLSPTANDVIKGLTNFAMYDGTKWVGTLNRLIPGEGYMYYSTTAKTFKYSSVKATPFLKSLLKEAKVAEKPWPVNERKYPSNMNFVAKLYSNNEIVEPGIFTIGAFAGDECRGIGEYVNGLLFITVHGSLPGETISFKAIENATGGEVKVKESPGFGETVLGSPNQPYKLNLLNIVSGIEEYKLFLTIYPNPVKERLYIGGDLQNIKKVQVLSMAGGIVVSPQIYSPSEGLDVSALPYGGYLIAISLDKGMIYRKFIKSENSKN